MKIKNEYIKIKNGKKTTTLHNYIYHDYLVPFSKLQYEVNDPIDVMEEQQKKILSEIYIRFDTPLQDITNATINDFEIFNTDSKINIDGLSNSVKTTYEYNIDNAFKISDYTKIDISDYYNKKITALGFGNNMNIYACLDVSNYEIYVLEGEQIFITRKDIMTTEGDCYDYDYPVHLMPTGDIKNAEYNSVTETYEPLYAKLYSIGFSKTRGVLDEEYVIGEDIDVKVESDTSFGFNLSKGEDETIYPQETLYTLDSIYPLPPYVREELYPQDRLFPRDDLFARDSNYKYIFYRFRLYTIHWNGNTPQSGTYEIKYLDKYYTMILKNNTTGLFEIVTKIERSDD